jgi:hypothetical protein
MANEHNVVTLECPDLNAFVAASPGAIICQLSKLLVLVFSEGDQLLIKQAITGLTSTHSGRLCTQGWHAGGRSPVIP